MQWTERNPITTRNCLPTLNSAKESQSGRPDIKMATLPFHEKRYFKWKNLRIQLYNGKILTLQLEVLFRKIISSKSSQEATNKSLWNTRNYRTYLNPRCNLNNRAVGLHCAGLVSNSPNFSYNLYLMAIFDVVECEICV